MSTWNPTGGYASRGGLSARTGGGQGGHVQINVDPENRFDFDERVDILRGGVGKLKEMARAIGEEAREQGSLIDSLTDVIERARAKLQHNMGRLGVVQRQASGWHLLWLVLFAVGLMLSLYLLSKAYHTGRWLFGY